MTHITLRREWAMPSEWTFEIKPIREVVEREVRASGGLWIDPFAGQSTFADVTNDLDPGRTTDFSKRASEFLQDFEDCEVDGGVLFDPPYSVHQIKEKYNSVGVELRRPDTQSAFYATIRDEIARVVAEGATVISCGWNSSGIGKRRGFSKREILLVCHGGAHNDTIVTTEEYRRIGQQTTLADTPDA